jgi:hypothetical protein
MSKIYAWKNKIFHSGFEPCTQEYYEENLLEVYGNYGSYITMDNRDSVYRCRVCIAKTEISNDDQYPWYATEADIKNALVSWSTEPKPDRTFTAGYCLSGSCPIDNVFLIVVP